MNKPSVVLDTNIYISSLFWGGASYKIVQKAIEQQIIVFISKEILKEIEKVLIRDFNLEKQEIEDVLEAIILFTHIIEVNTKLDLVQEDPDDNKILECAFDSNSNYIVTQDKHLLKLGKFIDIKITSPENFLKTKHF